MSKLSCTKAYLRTSYSRKFVVSVLCAKWFRWGVQHERSESVSNYQKQNCVIVFLVVNASYFGLRLRTLVVKKNCFCLYVWIKFLTLVTDHMIQLFLLIQTLVVSLSLCCGCMKQKQNIWIWIWKAKFDGLDDRRQNEDNQII